MKFIDISESLKIAINDENIELEFIYGKPFKQNLDKEIFVRLLNYCKETYRFIDDENYLDIRTEIIQRGRSYISNIRSTIKGLQSIKEYCLNDTLNNETIHIKKVSLDNKIKDIDYNFRVNLKNEIILRHNHNEIISLLNNWKLKNKYLRFKKRYSFLTPDNFYRIDLTIVKSSHYNNTLNKYEMTELFKTSNILNQPEYYELELEFIGNQKEYNINSVNNVYQKLSPKYNYTESNDDDEIDIN